MSLKTDYKDFELAPEMGGKKRYKMINNDDGTVSFVDVSEYLEIGDAFKAEDINATNNTINEKVDLFGKKLPNDTDFNSITTSGHYSVYTNTNSPRPEGNYTYSVVVISEGSILSQMATMTYTGNLVNTTYTRIYKNGTWSSWAKLATSDEVIHEIGYFNPTNSQVAWNGSSGVIDVAITKITKNKMSIFIHGQLTKTDGSDVFRQWEEVVVASNVNLPITTSDDQTYDSVTIDNQGRIGKFICKYKNNHDFTVTKVSAGSLDWTNGIIVLAEFTSV